jgi:cytochrome c5
MKKNQEIMNSYSLYKTFKLGLLFGLIAFSVAGCYYDNEEDLYPVVVIPACDTVNVSYAATVLPVLESECYSCHDQSTRFGNVLLEGYDNLKTYVDNGLFWGAIAHLDGFSAMPKGGNRLPDCDLDKIQAWINQGAPNN